MSTEINIDPPPSPRKTILSNKLTPVVLMVLNITFFFYLIPLHIAVDYDIVLAILGGIITLILSFWVAFALTPKLFDEIPIIMGVACISTLFVFGFFFISKTTDFSSNEIRENGVAAEAIIVDMTQILGKRGHTIQSMDVAFKTPDGQQHEANIILSEREYDSFERGMIVPVIYSSEYPEIARMDHGRLRRGN